MLVLCYFVVLYYVSSCCFKAYLTFMSNIIFSIYFLPSFLPSFTQATTFTQYEGRKERRKEGKKERRKGGRKGGRKEGKMVVILILIPVLIIRPVAVVCRRRRPSADQDKRCATIARFVRWMIG